MPLAMPLALLLSMKMALLLMLLMAGMRMLMLITLVLVLAAPPSLVCPPQPQRLPHCLQAVPLALALALALPVSPAPWQPWPSLARWRVGQAQVQVQAQAPLAAAMLLHPLPRPHLCLHPLAASPRRLQQPTPLTEAATFAPLPSLPALVPLPQQWRRLAVVAAHDSASALPLRRQTAA